MQLVSWGILPCIVVVKLLGVLILHATSRIARPPGDGQLVQLLGVTLRSSYHIHISWYMTSCCTASAWPLVQLLGVPPVSHSMARLWQGGLALSGLAASPALVSCCRALGGSDNRCLLGTPLSSCCTALGGWSAVLARTRGVAASRLTVGCSSVCLAARRHEGHSCTLLLGSQ